MQESRKTVMCVRRHGHYFRLLLLAYSGDHPSPGEFDGWVQWRQIKHRSDPVETDTEDHQNNAACQSLVRRYLHTRIPRDAPKLPTRTPIKTPNCPDPQNVLRHTDVISIGLLVGSRWYDCHFCVLQNVWKSSLHKKLRSTYTRIHLHATFERLLEAHYP